MSAQASAQSPPRTRRGPAEWVREVLLWVLAAFGSVCLVMIVLVTVLDLGVVVFRTGSMSPTIPTGAAALVRSVPAAEVHVGDVVTVATPVGPLPVTHRVVSTEAAGGGQYLLHLKGDANDVVDPFDYRVDQVRRVVVSAPGVGYALVWLSDPRRMAALTVLVAVVVAWTFWPRADVSHGRRRAERGRPRRTRDRVRAAAILVVLGGLATVGVGGASRAVAATSYPVPENGAPGMLSLTSSMPLDEQWVVAPGGQLRWQVQADLEPSDGVDADGELLVELVADGPLAETDDAAQVSLDECVGATDAAEDCIGTTRVLLATTSLGQALHTAPVEVGAMSAGESRVVIVTLDVADDLPEEQSLAMRLGLVFSASGDSASVLGSGAAALPGGDPLPYTGADLRFGALGLLLATAGLVVLVRTRAARRSTR